MGTQTGTGGFPAIEDAASGGEVQERFRGTELLPCPFCGGEGHAARVGHSMEILCQSCGAAGALLVGREEAIAAWNTRTALKARGD